MKISILDWNTVSPDGDISPQKFSDFGELKIFQRTKPENVIENIADSEIVLCNKVLITGEVMKSCPQIKYIGLFATGYNNIDIKCAGERGITVCNAGSYSTDAVAQQVFSYILDYCNRVSDYDSAVKRGEWINSENFSYFPYRITELAGKTVSIVGYGSIGRRVAEIADVFGMNVIIHTRTAPKNCKYRVTDLKTAVENADFLTFHCPLTQQTAKLVNGELLNRMKKNAVLINTSRGGVVDETALAEALKSGKIKRAYLDVLETEPMSRDTPLKNIPNCVITPHTAWAGLETRERLVKIVYENIDFWLKGSPQNVVIK